MTSFYRHLFTSKIPNVVKSIDALGTARNDRAQRGTASAQHADALKAAAADAIGCFTVSLDTADFDKAVEAVARRNAAMEVIHVASAQNAFSSTGREHVTNDQALNLVVQIVSTLETEIENEIEKETARLSQLGIVGDPDNAILRSLAARLEQARGIENTFCDPNASAGADREYALAQLVR